MTELASERYAKSNMLTFGGSARVMWRMTGKTSGLGKAATGTLAIITLIIYWITLMSVSICFPVFIAIWIPVDMHRKKVLARLKHRELARSRSK